MKRAICALLVAGVLSLSGCSTSDQPVKTVSNMIEALYFGQGSFEDYQNLFQKPEQTISAADFKKMGAQGNQQVFPKAESYADVEKNLKAFMQDNQNAVVYWSDFTLDKPNDLHWILVKTDKGWKIKN